MYGLNKDTFGASFEAYLGRVHPEDRDFVSGIIHNAFQAKQAFSFEERIVRPSGEIRYLTSWGNVVLDDDKNITQMFGACLDITEKKKADEIVSGLIASAE